MYTGSLARNVFIRGVFPPLPWTEPDGGVRGQGRVDTKASPAQETAWEGVETKLGRGNE